jgi:MEMO1 family protein
MSNSPLASGVVCGALLPHAPILIPGVGGPRHDDVATTMSAMRKAARSIIGAAADTLVVISPHSPRMSKPVGIWRGERLRGSLRAFRVPHLAVDLPADSMLADVVATLCTRRGLDIVSIAESSLDYGATVPLWFIAEAGWNRPTTVLAVDCADRDTLVALGETIAEAAASTRRRVALIASGDMSHRLTSGAPLGYDPRGREFDCWLVDTLERGAYRDLLRLDPHLEVSAGQDVIAPLLVVLAALRFSAAGGELCSYEAPFGVGYGVAILSRDRMIEFPRID